MKQAIELPVGITLFSGLSGDEIQSVLACLSARTKAYGKDDFIFRADDRPADVGIVLSGDVIVLREDFWGNRDIITKIGAGELFGESFSFAGAERIPVSAAAASACSVLFIDCRRLITVCSNNCSHHTTLIYNMMHILANKNILLTQKMEHLTKRSTRAKLMSYLSQEANAQQRNPFFIPFDRQEMADYLSVDRSALSAELGRLRDAGFVSFRKNEFRLLHAKPLP